MDEGNDILKNTPDYESYTLNEVKLTREELRELGILKCGGCNKSSGGCCKKNSKCCRS